MNNAIERGVGQLCTTNRNRVMEVFLEPALLLSGQNKYTNIKGFWKTKQECPVSKKY